MPSISDSEVATASFRGTAMMELYSNGATQAESETAEEASVRHVPGGNRSVIQSSGLLQQQITLPVGVTASALTALRGAVGKSGSLVWHGGTRTARLSSVNGVEKVAGHDAYKANLLLYLL